MIRPVAKERKHDRIPQGTEAKAEEPDVPGLEAASFARGPESPEPRNVQRLDERVAALIEPLASAVPRMIEELGVDAEDREAAIRLIWGLAEQTFRAALDRPPVTIAHESVPSGPAATPAEFLRALKEVDERIAGALVEPRAQLQALCDALEGKSFKADDYRAVVDGLQRAMNRLGLRVECQGDGCGRPAILRHHGPVRGMTDGYVQFEHFIESKQTHHGAYKAFPKLKLVPAPPDRRRRDRRETKDESSSPDSHPPRLASSPGPNAAKQLSDE